MISKHSEEEYNIIDKIKESIVFTLSVYLVAILVVWVRYFIGAYFPDFISEYFLQNFNLLVEYLNPERFERAAFYTCVFSFPLIYFFLLKFMKRLDFDSFGFLGNCLKSKLSFVILVEVFFASALTVISCIYMDKDALNYLYLGVKSIPFYVFSYFLLTAAVLFYQKFGKKADIVLNYIGIIILLIILYALSKLYYTPAYDFSDAAVMHFSSYFAPVYKVYSGQTIGIDFTNLYGFYPYFYELIFKLFHKSSIQFFSVINTVLVCLSVIFVAMTLYLNIKNKLIALVFFLAYVYLYNLINVFSTQSVFYLQFMPHRIFFITLIFALASIYLKTDNGSKKNLLAVCGYIISCAAILWNTESGLVVLVAWSCFLFYIKLFLLNNEPVKDKIKILLPYMAAPFLTVLAAFICVEILTYMRTGQWLDFYRCFYFQALFYKSGYYMLRMPLISHPWFIILIIYAIAEAKVINCILSFQNCDKDQINRAAIYIMLAIAGMGLFVYYQGRSYILNLFIVSFPALLILAGFADEWLYNMPKDYKFLAKFYWLKPVLLMLPVSYFSLSCLYCVFVKNPNFSFDIVKKNTAEAGICMQNYRFITENTDSAKMVDIITLDSSMLYSMLNKKDTLRFNSVVDWSDKEQYNKIFEYLEKSKAVLVMDRYTLNNLKMYEKDKLEKLFRVQNYTLRAFNENLYIFENKK